MSEESVPDSQLGGEGDFSAYLEFTVSLLVALLDLAPAQPLATEPSLLKAPQLAAGKWLETS